MSGVHLSDNDLRQEEGREILNIALRICSDGKLELSEIKELWRWLVDHKGCKITSVVYLSDIMNRITADKVIDRDELMELHLAIERIIPTSLRSVSSKARKEREKELICIKKEQEKEARRIEKENAKKFESIRWDDLNHTQGTLRYTFSKVAGISFMNDDFTERQQIAQFCEPGDYLVLRHDPNNSYSYFAIQVLRDATKEQLGHVPEYLARILYREMNNDNRIFGVVKNKTGGEGKYFGINFNVFIVNKNIEETVVREYVREVCSRDKS